MNKEKQLEQYITIILSLEKLGIRIEDTKEEKDKYGFPTKTVYYYSVPESSTIEIADEKLNPMIKTADGLKTLAKENLVDIVIDACEQEFGDDKEFIEEVKSNISQYVKFYARVRKGEVWTEELGNKRVKELIEEMHQAAGYSEV